MKGITLEATNYNELYLSAEYLFRDLREDMIYDKIHIKPSRLLSCCYMVLCNNRNRTYTNLIENKGSIYDLKELILQIYNAPLNSYQVFDKYFYDVIYKTPGFIPHFNHYYRIIIHQELKKFTLDEIKKAIVLDALYNIQARGDEYYLYYIDFTDYNILNEFTNDYNDYFNEYNDDYDCYEMAYEDLLMLQFHDAELFLEENPSHNDKIDYLYYICDEYIVGDLIDIFGLSEEDLEKHDIDFYKD